MKKQIRLINLLIIIVLFLSACNLPSGNTDGEGLSLTAAAQTVEALLSATPSSKTNTPAIASTITLIPSPIFTSTPAATATPNCPLAQFVTDVTIPDGTAMNPGQTFNKKWRLKNIGACAWNGYSLVFDSGESLNGPASKAIGSVNPGQEIDIDVDLKAPNSAGTYRSYWRLVTNGNVLVPIVSGYQGRAFYVEIKVAVPTNTSAPAFAVTSITYSLGTWSDAGHTNCPRVTANITANGAGNVTFKWGRQDSPNGGAIQNLNFATAGTQAVNYDWSRGSVWAGTATWVGIYVDNPNNQDFGKIDFSTACTAP